MTSARTAATYGGLAVSGAAALAAAAALPALTADLVRRQGRKQREAPRPGTFSATVGDSEMTVYTDGRSLYDDMVDAIGAAEDIIVMENYMWKADEDGLAFIEALNAAADRGVDVYVIYDGLGNLVVPRSFYRNFSDKVHVARLPVVTRKLWTAPVRTTGVCHSKILVVDDHTGFVGGYNIGSEFAGHWRDTHVRQVGPKTWGLRNAVTRVWNQKWPDGGDIPWTAPDSWDSRIQVVANLPVQLVYPLRNMYLTAIERARDHIWITTPYFIPDQQILQALYRASDRGVDVRLMVPKESNHMIADWVSRGFYGEILEHGITLHLYATTMIHAKTATIDGEWSTVGTANIDRLSLSFNYETNIEVTDKDFAATLEEIFTADIEHCETVNSTSWRDEHPLSRVAEIALMPLRKVL
ncbi:MAG: phospholipase D-like domain-containing protein [Corynebacterium sp.]|uniref:phospholipase D-like domain-containing protein n=1 Tax=Corynebacterium sp. TaxID=1720 RepID=UPI0026495E0F|nr:phospholipase D-like domain-containing protein [Corynebacterium sp.]MDN5719750.1 phospholipase D-like domain-containing protein [Corynebacterium sp.]